ncbi:MAG: hypothetical protein JW754_04285 [Candidatus Aenigmarchaeota archaeon]|nr:hypothetical protein [Candidatus Aenigmarchaeota archaeon]
MIKRDQAVKWKIPFLGRNLSGVREPAEEREEVGEWVQDEGAAEEGWAVLGQARPEDVSA